MVYPIVYNQQIGMSINTNKYKMNKQIYDAGRTWEVFYRGDQFFT